MATVSLQGVQKIYPNGVEALRPSSFEIEEKELIVLVGPSGCGKSTLLRMIAGLEEISEGVLEIAGRVVNDLDPAERDIAMVFQNYALYPHMTVYNNMAYGLKNRGVSKAGIDAKVREASAMLNLDDYLTRRPSQLSGGQRQRVAMGRAIVRSPKLFLFDEPLSNLDAKLRTQMRIEIRALQRRIGVTSIYVTHDQVEAMTMADRIVVLNGGRIEQIGAPAEIYDRPASTFVASFMGAPPMNLIPVTCDGAGAARVDETTSFPTSSSHKGAALLGVRPEKALLSDTPTGVVFALDLIEELGANRLLHGMVAGHPFIVNVAADMRPESDQLHLMIPPDAFHLFDNDGGARI